MSIKSLKCLAQGHYWLLPAWIRTRDLSFGSLWSYPLSHNRIKWAWGKQSSIKLHIVNWSRVHCPRIQEETWHTVKATIDSLVLLTHATVTPARKAVPWKPHKVISMWLSCGSYGVYMAITVYTVHMVVTDCMLQPSSKLHIDLLTAVT